MLKDDGKAFIRVVEILEAEFALNRVKSGDLRVCQTIAVLEELSEAFIIGGVGDAIQVSSK